MSHPPSTTPISTVYMSVLVKSSHLLRTTLATCNSSQAFYLKSCYQFSGKSKAAAAVSRKNNLHWKNADTDTQVHVTPHVMVTMIIDSHENDYALKLER